MDSTNPRTSGTAQRLAELRAEMRVNQEQIQQLSEAHRAVQNAVSGINATQELLHVAPMHGAGTIITAYVSRETVTLIRLSRRRPNSTECKHEDQR